MFRRARDPFAWIAAGPPKDYGVVRLRGQSYLVKLDRGALLSWTFAEPGDRRYVLMVRLTDREAQKVFEADDETGMIEPVRKTMKYNGALLLVPTGKSEGHGRRILIPREVPEYEFLDDLMRAADTVEEHYENVLFSIEAKLASLRTKRDEARAEVEKIRQQIEQRQQLEQERHDLEFARPFLKVAAI